MASWLPDGLVSPVTRRENQTFCVHSSSNQWSDHASIPHILRGVNVQLLGRCPDFIWATHRAWAVCFRRTTSPARLLSDRGPPPSGVLPRTRRSYDGTHNDGSFRRPLRPRRTSNHCLLSGPVPHAWFCEVETKTRACRIPSLPWPMFFLTRETIPFEATVSHVWLVGYARSLHPGNVCAKARI